MHFVSSKPHIIFWKWKWDRKHRPYLPCKFKARLVPKYITHHSKISHHIEPVYNTVPYAAQSPTRSCDELFVLYAPVSVPGRLTSHNKMSNNSSLKITFYLCCTIVTIHIAASSTQTATPTNTKPTTTTISTTHITSASSVKPKGPQTYEYFMDTCSSQNKQFLYNIDDDVIVRAWHYPDDPRQKLPPVRCSFTIARYSATDFSLALTRLILMTVVCL